MSTKKENIANPPEIKMKNESDIEEEKSENENENENEDYIKEENKTRKSKKKKGIHEDEDSEDEENNENSSSEEKKKKKNKKKREKKSKKIKRKISSDSDEDDESSKDKISDKKTEKDKKKKGKQNRIKDNSSEEEEGKKMEKVKKRNKKVKQINSDSESESDNNKKEEKTPQIKNTLKEKKNNEKTNKEPAPSIKVNKNEIKILKKDDNSIGNFEEKKEKIIDIINFLEEYRVDIEMHEGDKEIKELIKEFKNKYYIFKNINRFCIPAIGCISSGKSTIFNYLLNLNKTLQVAEKITTKCVCIIRHRKGCKKPKIFNVDIQERGKGLYNFNIKKIKKKIKKKNIADEEEEEIEDEIKKNVAEVIKQRNELIEKNEIGFDYNKYFLIIEYDIPFFRGKFEKYADYFEFMDIPGLNEAPEATKTSKEEKAKFINSLSKSFYFNQIFPLIQNNIKFSLFIFSAENYDGKNATEILDSYIDGGIKEKKNKIKDEKKLSHSEKENERIKQQKNKEENLLSKLNFIESFKNSIFILNKIDHYKTPEKMNKGIENFRAFYQDYISKKKIELKLDDENQVGLIGNKLNDENSKLNSFEDYLKYYILYTKENSITQDKKISNFYEYILKIMKEEFKIKKIIDESEDDNEEEEEEEDEEEYDAKMPNFMKKEDFNNYLELKSISKFNDNIIEFLNKKEYCKLKKIFEKYSKNFDEKKNNDNGFKKKLKFKMMKTIEDYFYLDDYLSMKELIITKFNIDINKNSNKLLKQRLEKLFHKSAGIGNPKQLIDCFKEKIDLLDEFKQSNETIMKLKQKYNIISEYFKNSSAIRFLMVGPHNSGKSFLLNLIIGYNLNLLPTDLKECTKTGIIIKYAKKEEIKNNFEMYKAEFYQNEDGYNYFKYSDKINLEGKTITQKIDELNKANKDKKELNFYVIKTPIEFLDKIESITDEEKAKIELIDFPGLDTDFKKAKEKAKNLLKIIDGFIYVNYQTAFSDDNKQILNLIYDTIKKRNDFSFDTCLFILNKIDMIKEKIDYEDISKQILKIFDDSNRFELSKDVINQKQRFKDDELTLTGFSCLRYKEFKELNIFDFEKFIKINSRGIIGGNIIENIKYNLKNNYIKIKNYKKNIGEKNEEQKYTKQLKAILKNQNPEDEDIKEIVQLYIYILKNYKKINQYKYSNIDLLINRFENVIQETLCFFERKQRTDAIKFLENSYLEILEIYNIVKITLKDGNIDKFKKVQNEPNEEDIEKRALNTIDEINDKFNKCEDLIKSKIDSIYDEYSFNQIVNENISILDEFINEINNLISEFDFFLKNKYNKIINELELEQLEKDKTEFKEKMERLNQVNIQKVNRTFSKKTHSETRSSTYKVTKTVSLQVPETYYEGGILRKILTIATLGIYQESPKTRMKDVDVEVDDYRTSYYTVEVFDTSESKEKLRNDIKLYFDEGKEKSLDNIKNNKESTINNIKGIFQKFNAEITGFQNNFDRFEKIVKEVEKFILINTGLID